MPGIRTLADGHVKWAILTTKPADVEAVTVAEATAGVDISCQVAKSGTRISATTSDSISEPRLCDEIDSQALGASKYEGQMTVFWHLDPDTGAYVEADNPTFEVVREKGALFWILEVVGPSSKQPFAAGDLYSLYEVRNDNPQKASAPEGYIKSIVPLRVFGAVEYKTLAA